jgi:hypothetical protein
MAETVLLDGSNYEFEIFLVNTNESSSDFQIVPVSKSSIKYLEITNDLVNIGYTGKVIFSNYYGILEKLQLLTSYREAPYMYIRFKNLDFQSTKSTYDDVYLTASLQKGQEINLNAIDGSLAYNFEELSIAKLKRTKVSFLKTPSNTYFEQQPDLTDPLLGPSTPADLIKGFFLNGLADADIDGTISTTEVEIQGESNPAVIQTTAITNITDPDSYYQIIERLYPYLSFKTKLEGWYEPGVLNLENDAKTGKRKLVITSMFDHMQKFFELIKTNPTSKEVKNYLTERFNVAQTGDSPYFSNNYIDKYELKRVNYDDVFENKWTSIKLILEDPCNNDLSTIGYDKIRAAFENMCTKPFASNIPDRKNDVVADKIKKIQYSRPNMERSLAQVYGTNKVFKSFVFDNVAVTFRVKGQPYRRPGKFITIKTDNVDINNKKNKNIAEINGYWYIVSVSHVFENDVYFNDFICVKVYNPFENPAPAPSVPGPVTPSNTPSSNSASGTNTAAGGLGNSIAGNNNTIPTSTPGPESSFSWNEFLNKPVVSSPAGDQEGSLLPEPAIYTRENPRSDGWFADMTFKEFNKWNQKTQTDDFIEF